MSAIYEAREELLCAALTFTAAEKGDVTGAYYDANLELHQDMLDRAVRSYVEALAATQQETP